MDSSSSSSSSVVVADMIAATLVIDQPSLRKRKTFDGKQELETNEDVMYYQQISNEIQDSEDIVIVRSILKSFFEICIQKRDQCGYTISGGKNKRRTGAQAIAPAYELCIIQLEKVPAIETLVLLKNKFRDRICDVQIFLPNVSEQRMDIRISIYVSKETLTTKYVAYTFQKWRADYFQQQLRNQMATMDEQDKPIHFEQHIPILGNISELMTNRKQEISTPDVYFSINNIDKRYRFRFLRIYDITLGFLEYLRDHYKDVKQSWSWMFWRNEIITNMPVFELDERFIHFQFKDGLWELEMVLCLE